jgi:GTP:adenosylcobinamide-phosphate guanylyltransferase
MTTANQSRDRRFTALVLAGTRPKGDPLARAAGVSHKALVPLVGRPMLWHVIAALRRSRSVERIIVCGLSLDDIGGGELRRVVDANDIRVVPGRSTPSASVNHVLESTPGILPLLVTTADHPLLTPEIVDEFCARMSTGEYDAGAAVVPADLVRRAFPDSNRTYLRFRERAYSGCNLFAILTQTGLRAPAWWTRIEEHRKRPWRMMSMLGPGVVVRFVLGRMSLAAIEGYVSRKMNLRAAVTVLSHPEAGYDVDTVDHMKVAEAVLRSQHLGADGLTPAEAV